MNELLSSSIMNDDWKGANLMMRENLLMFNMWENGKKSKNHKWSMGKLFYQFFCVSCLCPTIKESRKKKNGAPQNWFFSASMSLHLFEWLHIPRNEKTQRKGAELTNSLLYLTWITADFIRFSFSKSILKKSNTVAQIVFKEMFQN